MYLIGSSHESRLPRQPGLTVQFSFPVAVIRQPGEVSSVEKGLASSQFQLTDQGSIVGKGEGPHLHLEQSAWMLVCCAQLPGPLNRHRRHPFQPVAVRRSPTDTPPDKLV